MTSTLSFLALPLTTDFLLSGKYDQQNRENLMILLEELFLHWLWNCKWAPASQPPIFVSLSQLFSFLHMYFAVISNSKIFRICMTKKYYYFCTCRKKLNKMLLIFIWENSFWDATATWLWLHCTHAHETQVNAWSTSPQYLAMTS